MKRINFTGEHDCKIDAKGRIMLPIAFRRQMGAVEAYCFVVKPDLDDKCLELYPTNEWDYVNEQIMMKNKPFNEKFGKALRIFRKGAMEVECDPSGRIMLPKRLLTQVGITDEAVFAGFFGKIEIWEPTRYLNNCSDEESKRAFVEGVLGEITFNTQLS